MPGANDKAANSLELNALLLQFHTLKNFKQKRYLGMNQPIEPTSGALLERAISLCNREMIAVDMQYHRLKATNIVDFEGWWADFQFLIVALSRLRRSASIAVKSRQSITAALSEFDKSIPNLKRMRDIAEHIDSYAHDSPKRHDQLVQKGQLQVSMFDGNELNWLGVSFDIEKAFEAAIKLNSIVKATK